MVLQDKPMLLLLPSTPTPCFDADWLRRLLYCPVLYQMGLCDFSIAYSLLEVVHAALYPPPCSIDLLFLCTQDGTSLSRTNDSQRTMFLAHGLSMAPRAAVVRWYWSWVCNGTGLHLLLYDKCLVISRREHTMMTLQGNRICTL